MGSIIRAHAAIAGIDSMQPIDTCSIGCSASNRMNDGRCLIAIPGRRPALMARATKAAPASNEPDLEQSNGDGQYVDTIVPFLHPREHSAEVGPVLREQRLTLAIQR